jgi:hypothetical protein
MPNPQQLATATAALINGASQVQAARQAGMDRGTLRHNLTPALQDRIRQAQIDLIDASLQKAVENQQLKIEAANTELNSYKRGSDLRPGAKTILELADKAEDRLLQSVGINPSHTQSAQYLNLTQINLEITPEVARLLRFDALDVSESDVIDVMSDDNVQPIGSDAANG